MKEADRRLHDAIRAGNESNGYNAELIEKLITQEGADVNSIDEETATMMHPGMPALICAIKSNNVSAVRILINHRVDLTGQVIGTDGLGVEVREMPLQHAFGYGLTDYCNIEIIRLLLESGADANGAPFRHGGFLHRAAMDGQIELMQLLVKHGADINRMALGTPLHWAVFGKNLAVIEWLIDRNAQVNLGDFITPLDASVQEGFFEIALFLMRHGATCKSTKNDGINFLVQGKRNFKSFKYGTPEFNVDEIPEKFYIDLRLMLDKLIGDEGIEIGKRRYYFENPVNENGYAYEEATELHAAVILNAAELLEPITIGFIPSQNRSLRDFFNQPMRTWDPEQFQRIELTPLALAMRLNRPEMVFEIIQIYLEKKWDLKDVKEQVSQWAKKQAKEEWIDGRRVANIYSDILDLFIEKLTEEESNPYCPRRCR